MQAESSFKAPALFLSEGEKVLGKWEKVLCGGEVGSLSGLRATGGGRLSAEPILNSHSADTGQNSQQDKFGVSYFFSFVYFCIYDSRN